MIQWNDQQSFYEIDEWKQDTSLTQLIKECVDLQRQVAENHFQSNFKPEPNALQEVSEEKLNQILERGQDVHGISSEREISNVIVFNEANIDDSISDDELKSLRAKIDRKIEEKVKGLFESSGELVVTSSGHFWYPPGGYMSWHTNAKAPGWRLYINYAREPHKSFFRYRDPATGKIFTCQDEVVNFRLFRVHESIPLWHTIYSETDRFSIGYRIRQKKDVYPPIWKRLYWKLASKVKAYNNR